MTTMVQMIGRDRILRGATNPRKRFDEAKLKELADTIKLYGIVQPLVVRKARAGLVTEGKALHEQPQNLAAQLYELVAGERRWRAAGIAGLNELPCLVRELSDKDVLRLQYIENLQREDLTPLEEGEGFARLLEEKIFTVETLMAELGKSRSHVFSRLKLSRLQGPVRDFLERDEIPATIAGLAAQLPTAKVQRDFLGKVLNGLWDHQTGKQEPLSFRSAKALLEREFIRPLKGEWDLKDAALVRGAGSCAECPKRTGNIPGCEGSPNVCTDLGCFASKRDAANALKLRAAEAAGQRVLRDNEWQRVQHGPKYDEPAERCWHVGDGKKTWQQLLGKDLPIVIAETREGVKEKVDVERANDLLRERGVIKESRSSSSAGSDKAARAKAVLDAKLAAARAEAIVAATERTKPTLPMWRHLAHATANSCWHDTAVEVAKRRGLHEKGRSANDQIAKAVENYSESECLGLLVEILIARGLRGDWHVRDDMKALQQELKLDLREVDARAKAELAPKKKGPKVLAERAEQNAKIAKFKAGLEANDTGAKKAARAGQQSEFAGLKGTFTTAARA